MKKIASIGCGALGTIFARALVSRLADNYQLLGVFDLNAESSRRLADELSVKAYASFDELIAEKPEIVVEIAGVPAARAYGEKVLRAGCDLVVVSVGALADKELKTALEQAASESGRKMYVVNGAIGGLDLMQTVALMGVEEACITNVKAPASLNGAPYLNGRELPEDREEIVFDGSVEQAIAGFPKNVNVAVATALACECPGTRVVIKSVPGLPDNQHHIDLKGGGLTARLSICSLPDPANPKSSTSAAWSVIALLKNLASPVQYF